MRTEEWDCLLQYLYPWSRRKYFGPPVRAPCGQTVRNGSLTVTSSAGTDDEWERLGLCLREPRNKWSSEAERYLKKLFSGNMARIEP